MQPTLEDIRTARASARQRRDHNARRLKRIVLRLITRVEAYEHEMSLLTRVERDVIANGKPGWELPAIFSTPAGRAETRFDGGVCDSAVLTPLPPSDAPETVGERRRNEMRATPSAPLGLPAAGDAW